MLHYFNNSEHLATASILLLRLWNFKIFSCFLMLYFNRLTFETLEQGKCNEQK